MTTEHYFQFEPQAGISFIPFVAAICISVALIKSIISIQNSLNRKIFTLKIQKRPYPWTDAHQKFWIGQIDPPDPWPLWRHFGPLDLKFLRTRKNLTPETLDQSVFFFFFILRFDFALEPVVKDIKNINTFHKTRIHSLDYRCGKF